MYKFINQRYDFQKIIDNSVVYIETIEGDVTNSCSGFVYKKSDNKTYIVTASHCINNLNNIYVYNSSKVKAKANIVGFDYNNDVAVLSISDNLGLKKVNISKDKSKVGDNIYVIGTPLDINYIGTLSHGIISHLNRKVSIKKENSITTYNTIQIDAPINSGNSGSILINNKGETIGMIIIKDDNLEGVSFALNIKEIKNTIEEIIKNV